MTNRRSKPFLEDASYPSYYYYYYLWNCQSMYSRTNSCTILLVTAILDPFFSTYAMWFLQTAHNLQQKRVT